MHTGFRRKNAFKALSTIVVLFVVASCGGGGDAAVNTPASPSSQYWGAAELIETDDAGSAQYPQIATDADGNAIAVWQQSDGARYNIQANRFDGTTLSWGAAELIESDDAGSAQYPQIATDADGNAIAVWHQFDGARNSIYANRFE